MNLKKWAEKRSLQTPQLEKIELPRSFSDLLSSLDKETSILLKSYLSEKSHIKIEDLEKCLTQKAFKDALIKKQPSAFHRKLTEEKIYKSAKQVAEALYYLSARDLSKAIHPEEFKASVVDQVDKDAPRWLDHKDQMAKFPANQNFVAFTKHPDNISSTVPKHDGISSKMVHELWHDYTGAKPKELAGTEHFMTKPYHQKVESQTNHLNHFPQGGWSTMTTKALFNAGNIGHLAEDVGVHEHEGTPITVHKFHPKADIIWNHQGGEIDPLQIHQIGVMDYLTNNVDRHAANLMSYPMENGKSNILAIDHERNFGYNQSMNDQEGWSGAESKIQETPFDYMGNLGGLTAANQYTPEAKTGQNFNYKPLADWWSKNGMKIQKEMATQLGSIKDSAVRKHIYDNFMNRWDRMNDWADNAKKTGHYSGVETEQLFEPAQMKKFKQPVNKKILETLPKNPKDALSAIYDIVNRKHDYNKGLNGKQVSQLSGVVKDIVNKMSPEEISDVYNSSKENHNWNKAGRKHVADLHIRNVIMEHLYHPEGFTGHAPAYKLNHMKAIADAIDSNPSSNEIEKQHSDKLKGIIERTVRGAA